MLKPMDIHNTEFKRTFKGYDPEEVDSFLANIVIKYETVYQENRKLHDEVKTLRQQLEGQGHQEQDILDLISLTKQTVQEAKTVARQEADNVVNVAQSEAERIMVEARLKAQQLLAGAEERLQKTERAERQLREKIRLMMETIWNVLIDDVDKPEATRPYREFAPASVKNDDPQPEE
ncbi:MAG TPA: DivIVA domain-containing protein [Limnochordia bacterium]|nr:DivIVA domain-containing protein [Limnochordia bacterium]